jgi:hypothetical protein
MIQKNSLVLNVVTLAHNPGEIENRDWPGFRPQTATARPARQAYLNAGRSARVTAGPDINAHRDGHSGKLGHPHFVLRQ